MEQKERVQEVTERTVVEYFDRLDALVSSGTVLYIYGGAAVAVLGSRIRTTMDIDVAEPYSRIDRAEFMVASAKAGLPVNPDADYDSAFLELVGAFRLCVPEPTAENPGVVVYSGRNLTVRTGSAADLIASKLVRYDEQDQQDIQFLLKTGAVTLEAVKESASRLPAAFREDALVRENLANLGEDMKIWGVGA